MTLDCVSAGGTAVKGHFFFVQKRQPQALHRSLWGCRLSIAIAFSKKYAMIAPPTNKECIVFEPYVAHGSR